ncbi:MAG: hypothetical protein JSV32_07935 [Dehalococcoidia bacterium]|nr:MAG: hypothetical protein JSV32_07935 [Dehalococcoidia bacterium]
MSEYPISWMNPQLITGKQFSVAICGYEGRICFLCLERDGKKRFPISKINVEKKDCDMSNHCMALECTFNNTNRENLLEMLGMQEDEKVLGETAHLWGTDSMLEGLLKLIKQVEKEIWINTGKLDNK